MSGCYTEGVVEDEVKSVPEVWKVTWRHVAIFDYSPSLSREDIYVMSREAYFYSEEEAKDHAAVLHFAHEFIGNTYDLCVEIKKMQ